MFPKANYVFNPLQYEFDEKCGLPAYDNADYYRFGESGASMTQTSPSLANIKSTFAATTNMVAYCVQDNAGNVTRGVYPSDPV